MPVKLKRCRPPSWRRRAAKQAQGKQARVAAPWQPLAENNAPSHQLRTSPVGGSTVQATTVARNGRSTGAPTQPLSKQHCTTAKPLKASKYVIPRHTLFFTAGFASKPGFPASHPLTNRSTSTLQCMQTMHELLTLIWGPCAPAKAGDLCVSKPALRPRGTCHVSNATSRSGPQNAVPMHAHAPATTHSKTQPLVRLRRDQQKEVARILHEMAQRAAKLPWKSLLEHHCPAHNVRELSQPHASHVAADADGVAEWHCSHKSQSAAAEIPRNHPKKGRVCGSELLSKGDVDRTLELGSFRQVQAAGTSAQPRLKLPGSCPHRAVCGLLRAVLKRLLPNELLGSRHNRGVFCDWACRIACMGRFEDVALHTVMQHMRSRDVRWLNTACVSAT